MMGKPEGDTRIWPNQREVANPAEEVEEC